MNTLFIKNNLLKSVSILSFIVAFFFSCRLIGALIKSPNILSYMIAPIGFIGMLICIGIAAYYAGTHPTDKAPSLILIPLYLFVGMTLLGMFGSFIF